MTAQLLLVVNTVVTVTQCLGNRESFSQICDISGDIRSDLCMGDIHYRRHK